MILVIVFVNNMINDFLIINYLRTLYIHRFCHIECKQTAYIFVPLRKKKKEILFFVVNKNSKLVNYYLLEL